MGSSSSGPNRIPTKVVKFILSVILCALTRLVNLSFKNSVFPSGQMRPRVIILFKGGSRNDPANYCPLSVLSVFSKIFEKAMLSPLLDYKHFFHDFQFGFRAKHSTEHACATHLNYLNSALDSGLIPAALFLMFEKHLTH